RVTHQIVYAKPQRSPFAIRRAWKNRLFQGQTRADLYRSYSHVANDPGSYGRPQTIRGEEESASHCVSEGEEDQCPLAAKTVSEYACDDSVDRTRSNRQGQDHADEKGVET